MDLPEDAIEINGSCGTIHCDDTGRVLGLSGAVLGDGDAPEYSDIVRIDLAEWRRFYDWGTSPITAIDILDVGYWYRGGDGAEHYEEPAHEWRTEDSTNANI